MHRSRCFAEGGFKIINGLPKMGKGPMESEEYQKMNKGASPSHPGGEDKAMHRINKQGKEMPRQWRQGLRHKDA